MKVLIIGFGSIAKKHLQVLRKIIPDVIVTALRSSNKSEPIKNIKNIYSWDEVDTDTDFVIITNPTSEHFRTIHKVINLSVPILIEKPPLASLEKANELINEIKLKNVITYTAFNLRFHPVIVWLKKHIEYKRIIEVQVYCGSYLPEWRPEDDYRKIYSAKKIMGGGAHLDLIHELDYIHYLFGLPLSINSFLSKKSDLEIDSFDSAHYWLEYANMNISVLLNYYRRDSKRYLEIVFDNETIKADLITWKAYDSKGKILFEAEPNLMKTYETQMKYFIDSINAGVKPMNSFEESVQTLELCLAK
jgi:predicted dehydrogenase